ncbi:hypothetical protein [Curtobacterium sp. MCSS17_016]|uniref:hypothetical protein n=1 Tax=Curtobacterium sp. MCSS17_016 TaxID=2175644 RepID=UPI0011B368D5|nr:hypothetical protein [Curtobacterium sp. MCSS17_016]WIE81482.1 hypothetical protein DEJ19_019795 [Curtobacterium sp. MCSS17_016]
MTGMTISRTASVARESARLGDGKFGEQHHDGDTVALDQTPRHEQPVLMRFTWTSYDGPADDHGTVIREADIDVRHLLDSVALDKLPGDDSWFDPTWLETAAIESGVVEHDDQRSSVSVGGYVDDGDDISAYVTSRRSAGLDLPIGALPDPAAAQTISEALSYISHTGVWDIDSESQRAVAAFATTPTAAAWREARGVSVDRSLTLWGAVNSTSRQVAETEVPTVAEVAQAMHRVADGQEFYGAARAATVEPGAQLADGCTCGQCGPGCAAAPARGCCGACTGDTEQDRCACAKHNDGSRTTFLCPTHADSDPCETTSRVTGKRRKGTIRNGRCTNCGWRG